MRVNVVEFDEIVLTSGSVRFQRVDDIIMKAMKVILFLTIGCLLTGSTKEDDVEQYLKIPPNFYFGVSTASYQIEGGWNASDKGVNVWDWWTHEKPSAISDRSNGDVACDSYHKYKEDVALLKDLGVNHYRISLSWSRILPNGFANVVSKSGIQYYKNLLDDLKTAGIEPMVTLYHFDHPHILEELGGWTNELMATWFADYASVVFRELGDRVKIWMTVNEPNILCNGAYQDGNNAPGKNMSGVGPYLCVHNMIKAHAKAYHIYNDEFRQSQKGKIGTVFPCGSNYPIYANDTESADISFQYECGWVGHTIFTDEGDYPAVMKERIAENSKLEGYSKSRLPEFTKEEIDYIRGTADFLGLNHYSSLMVEPAPKLSNTPWHKDIGIITSYNASWPHTASDWLRVVPQGLGDVLRKLKSEYNNLPIYITENGYPDRGTSLMDTKRIEYFHDYLREMLIAVNRDGCNVQGYSAWSFLDSFEWNKGYTEQFGMIRIDFTSQNRTRTPKLSYSWYKELLRTRKLPPRDKFIV